MFSRVLPGDESWVRHVNRIQNRIHAVENSSLPITRNFKAVPLAGNVVFLRGPEDVLTYLLAYLLHGAESFLRS